MSQPGNLSAAELDAIRSAAQWYARLASGAESEHDRAEWDRWHAADPLHRQAWQRIESVREQVARVPGRLAAPALQASAHSRRQVLRGVVVLVGAGSLGAVAWRSDVRQAWLADYRTAVGERRAVSLADGSSLLLNTATALDVHFDGERRLLSLRRGEILVSTAVDAQQRPFFVDTPHGRVQALGTRFTVRADEHGSEVAVLEKAVAVTPRGASQSVRLEAGQRLGFDAQMVGAARGNDASVGAWEQGSLIAIDRPLGEVLGELARYRAGWLRCDPAVAGLRVSGAFPLDDTDLALAALESGFPLQVVRRTRYWVSVVPRG